MTLIVAYQVMLYRYSKQEQILVGTTVANRNQLELEGLIGFFVNTVVIRTDLAGEPSFRELLRRVRETALGAFTHQDVPFEKVVEELQPERDWNRSPLFQTLFVLQNAPMPAMQFEGLKLSPMTIESGTAKFDLSLFMHEVGTHLKGEFEYHAGLFEAETSRRMVGHLVRLLESAVMDADKPISELEILTASEREQLLVGWNETARDYPEDQCLHELFEQQAERTPDAIAVTSGQRQLSYAALNGLAARLAARLVE